MFKSTCFSIKLLSQRSYVAQTSAVPQFFNHADTIVFALYRFHNDVILLQTESESVTFKDMVDANKSSELHL